MISKLWLRNLDLNRLFIIFIFIFTINLDYLWDVILVSTTRSNVIIVVFNNYMHIKAGSARLASGIFIALHLFFDAFVTFLYSDGHFCLLLTGNFPIFFIRHLLLPDLRYRLAKVNWAIRIRFSRTSALRCNKEPILIASIRIGKDFSWTVFYWLLPLILLLKLLLPRGWVVRWASTYQLRWLVFFSFNVWLLSEIILGCFCIGLRFKATYRTT